MRLSFYENIFIFTHPTITELWFEHTVNDAKRRSFVLHRMRISIIIASPSHHLHFRFHLNKTVLLLLLLHLIQYTFFLLFSSDWLFFLWCIDCCLRQSSHGGFNRILFFPVPFRQRIKLIDSCSFVFPIDTLFQLENEAIMWLFNYHLEGI